MDPWPSLPPRPPLAIIKPKKRQPADILQELLLRAPNEGRALLTIAAGILSRLPPIPYDG